MSKFEYNSAFNTLSDKIDMFGPNSQALKGAFFTPANEDYFNDYMIFSSAPSMNGNSEIINDNDKFSNYSQENPRCGHDYNNDKLHPKVNPIDFMPRPNSALQSQDTDILKNKIQREGFEDVDPEITQLAFKISVWINQFKKIINQLMDNKFFSAFLIGFIVIIIIWFIKRSNRSINNYQYLGF